MSQRLQNQQSHQPTTQPPSTHRQGKSLLNASANPTRLLIDNILSRHDSPPEADLLLYLTQFRSSTLENSWHSCGTDNAGLDGHCGQKQRKPALHELVKPYLDGWILSSRLQTSFSLFLRPSVPFTTLTEQGLRNGYQDDLQLCG